MVLTMLAASLFVSEFNESGDVLLVVRSAGADTVEELAASAQVEYELIDVSGTIGQAREDRASREAMEARGASLLLRLPPIDRQPTIRLT